MRRDDIAQRREQKKHMMVELRSLFSRYEDAGKPWVKQDAERRDYLLSSVETINGELQEQHNRELEEIRSAGGANGFQGTGLERSFAPEPLYQAFRSAGFARGERAEIPGRSSARSPGRAPSTPSTRRVVQQAHSASTSGMPMRRFPRVASTRGSPRSRS